MSVALKQTGVCLKFVARLEIPFWRGGGGHALFLQGWPIHLADHFAGLMRPGSRPGFSPRISDVGGSLLETRNFLMTPGQLFDALAAGAVIDQSSVFIPAEIVPWHASPINQSGLFAGQMERVLMPPHPKEAVMEMVATHEDEVVFAQSKIEIDAVVDSMKSPSPVFKDCTGRKWAQPMYPSDADSLQKTQAGPHV